MKTKHAKSSTLAGILAGAALAIAAFAPQTASAAAQPGSAANAKILNIVTVTYFDASGANQHQAATSTSVVVALKQAPLTVATQVAFPTVDSGASTTSYVALTANANGADDYKVTLSDTATNLSAGYTIVNNIVADPVASATGTAFTSGQTVRLGATSIVSVGAPGATQVVNIPAGTLNGIAAGSTVVIAGNSYKVTATTAGTQAGYTVTGNSSVTGSKTDEVLGSITISADTNGSNVAPALAAPIAGTIVGERKYLKMVETAVVSSNTADGTDDVMVSTDTATNSNPQALAAADRATFYHVSVSINKTVLNVTNNGAGATGKPGDVLEYTVTVTNTTLGNAGKVSIEDTVPAYTTLVSGGSYGAGGGSGVLTEKFATINDGSKTVEVTLDPNDTEAGNTDVGFGGAAAITAGTPIKFFIGGSSSNATGGTVAAGNVYTIKYQVKIN